MKIYILLGIIFILCNSFLIKKIENFKTKTEYYKIKQHIYKDLLSKTKEVLDEMRIPFFLSSGTCLGYYRERKIIDHDYDIDIGIFAEDYKDEIIRRLCKKGIFLYRVLGEPNVGMELSFIMPGTKIKRRAKIDIFLHYTNNDKTYWISYAAPKFKKRIKYQVSKFGIQKVNFLGMEVNVPFPTLKYIEEHYGNDWMIPKKPGKGYYYATSPKSIVNDE